MMQRDRHVRGGRRPILLVWGRSIGKRRTSDSRLNHNSWARCMPKSLSSCNLVRALVLKYLSRFWQLVLQICDGHPVGSWVILSGPAVNDPARRLASNAQERPI